MSVALEMRVVSAQLIIGAIVRNRIFHVAFERQLTIVGDRQVCALLVRCGDRLDTFTPQGDVMAMEQVERLCPGAAQSVLSAGL